MQIDTYNHFIEELKFAPFICSLALLPFSLSISFFHCLPSFIFSWFPFIQPLLNKFFISCAGCLPALMSESFPSYVPYMLLFPHPHRGPATLCLMVPKLRNIPEWNMIPHLQFLTVFWESVTCRQYNGETACVIQFLQVVCCGSWFNTVLYSVAFAKC